MLKLMCPCLTSMYILYACILLWIDAKTSLCTWLYCHSFFSTGLCNYKAFIQKMAQYSSLFTMIGVSNMRTCKLRSFYVKTKKVHSFHLFIHFLGIFHARKIIGFRGLVQYHYRYSPPPFCQRVVNTSKLILLIIICDNVKFFM